MGQQGLPDLLLRKDYMKAIVTNVSEVEINGFQSVTFDIVDKNDKVLVSSIVQVDVDQLVDQIKAISAEYEAKIKSAKRLKVGDVILSLIHI